MKVVFLRHGQSKSNVERVLDSALPGTSLTQQGVEQVRRVRAELEEIGLSKCYCSLFKRTVQTFKCLGFDIPLILENRIKEFDYGNCNRRKVEDVSLKIEEFFDKAQLGQNTINFCGDGETFQEFSERVQFFLEDLQRERKNVLVITHESVIIEALKQFSIDGKSFENAVELATPFVVNLDNDY